MRLQSILTVVGQLLGLWSAVSSTNELNDTVSSLAMRMKSVCIDTSDYASQCPTSSVTIGSENFKKPVVAEKHFIKVKRQNHIILTELIHRAFSNSSSPDQEPKFAFELLSAVFGVIEKTCPTVPPGFLQKVVHLFIHLHWKTAVDRTDYLPRKYQKWVTRLFNNCTENVEPLELLTDTCKETVVAVENCTEYICTQPRHEFHLIKADPIVDVVFKAFELVQSVCFPYFQESYRMFHYFHLTMADVFTDDIKIRWMTQLEGNRFWKNLLGPNYQIHLMNIEKCNQAAISSSPFYFRIPRESMPARVRLTGVRREFIG